MLLIPPFAPADDDAQTGPAPVPALAPVAVAAGKDAANKDAANKDAANKDAESAPPEFIKKIVNRELSFIYRVCEPSQQQMSAIVERATAAYRKMNDIIRGNERRAIRAGELMMMGPNGERMSQDPFKRASLDAMNYVKECVSESQHQDYLKELRARSDYQRRTAVDMAVGMIDDRIVLTDRQLTDLTEELVKSWTQASVTQMATYQLNTQYRPPIPENALREVLSKSQLESWNDIQRVTIWGRVPPVENLPGEEWIK